MTKTKFTDEILSLRQACCQQRSQRERDLHSSVKMDANRELPMGPKDEIRTRLDQYSNRRQDKTRQDKQRRARSFSQVGATEKNELGKLNGMSRVGGGKAEV